MTFSEFIQLLFSVIGAGNSTFAPPALFFLSPYSAFCGIKSGRYDRKVVYFRRCCANIELVLSGRRSVPEMTVLRYGRDMAIPLTASILGCPEREHIF